MPTRNSGDTWVGRTIDQYRVLSLVGAGGMGIVYRARDTRLGRDVALKVLPEEFSQDHERIVRAQREARLLASLNHPNIAAIYDLKDWEGNLCLVLEYVEGPNLAEHLHHKKPSVIEALNVALQIASALDAAHRAGVVHRDIKPANIKLTLDGRVKVLDFGLAKSLAAEGLDWDSSNASTLVTQVVPDKILGTPSYMSPEQVRGEPADKRADIWAFGCVLYELVAGRQLFSGRSLPEILACVLKTDPDWKALPRETPPHIRNLLARCLEKDPNRRLDDIAAARVEIEAGTCDQTRPAEIQASAENLATRSLAVLPFVNAGGNPEMDYLSDGLTESIIFSLSQLPELRVMSRSAAFRYKGRSDQAQQAGQELGVAAVLTGRVSQRHDSLVISAELVDVANGWQLWGDQYRRKSADIFTIEEDIAREISEKLRVKLTLEKKNSLTRRYTDNVEAYHLYLKGKFHWGKRTLEGLNRGIQYFRQAIEEDPTYALAYAGLAEGYVPLAVYCHVAPKDAVPKARAAAEKALEIDPKLAEARAVFAGIRSFFEWDPAAGEKEARAAVELDPKYPRARQVLSECLGATKRYEEAIAEVKRALDLDPLSLHMNAAVALTDYMSRRFKESIDYGLRAIELDPTFFPGYFYLGLAYAAMGQHAEAVAALEKATALSNNSTLMLAALGGAYAMGKQENEARRVLHELEELGRQRYVPQTFVAAIHAGLGAHEQAFDCLERACDERCSWLLRCLVSDQRLDVLRNEARFQSILKRVGLLH